MSLDLVMTVPGALGLYEFLTLTGMSPSLAGLMDSGCNTCNEGEICSAIQTEKDLISNIDNLPEHQSKQAQLPHRTLSKEQTELQSICWDHKSKLHPHLSKPTPD